jgi:hypothetical protein
MELIFKEKCQFCLKEESFSEYEEFNEGEIIKEPVLSFISKDM